MKEEMVCIWSIWTVKTNLSERMNILKPQDSEEQPSGDFRFYIDQENKEENKKKLDEDNSVSSSDNSEDEII